MDVRLKHEIEHSKKIAPFAESIWGWSGKAGSLRWERRVKMLTKGLKPHHYVLEVGCGTGLLTKEIVKTGAKVYSLDISQDLINIARDKARGKNVTFLCSNAYELGFGEETFDYIVGMSVLHHLDIDRTFREFVRVLKDGGKIVFSEPNMLNPQIFVERFFLREYFHNTPDETAFIRFSLKRKMRSYKFQNIKIYPFDFLHPKIPAPLVNSTDALSKTIERIPVISEFAGSLYIEATK